MYPEKANSIVSIILSLVPFVVVGSWLVYKWTKARSLITKKTGHTQRKIRVGDKIYVTKKVPRILVVEKETGKEAIVSTCGFDEDVQKETELKSLPRLVKVRYKLKNGIFSPEETDWLEGENFNLSGVVKILEYEEE